MWFAEAGRQLCVVARGRHLDPVAFRAPPLDPSANRSLRRHVSGSVTVSVRLGDRPADDILTDMVEGILAANRTDDPEHRGALLASVAHLSAVGA